MDKFKLKLFTKFKHIADNFMNPETSFELPLLLLTAIQTRYRNFKNGHAGKSTKTYNEPFVCKCIFGELPSKRLSSRSSRKSRGWRRRPL